MPNLGKENRFIRAIGDFSPMMRLLLPLLIFSSTFLIWVLFFYLPVNLELKKEQLFLTDYLKRKEIYQKTASSLANLENENKKLSEEYAKICSSSSCDSQKVLGNILKFLKQNDLSCIELTPLECKQNNLCKKEFYVLKAKGEFLRMISFLANLEKDIPRVKINEIEFLRKKHRKVLLDAKLRLVFFDV